MSDSEDDDAAEIAVPVLFTHLNSVANDDDDDDDSSSEEDALDALVGGGDHDAFLHAADAYAPEFDASKDFRPPPVSHADLLPTVPGERLVGAPKLGRKDLPEGQRYHREYEHEGEAGSGQRRLQGSVCQETDDERGRRVLYGAHQMVKADPWSECNPNRPLVSHAAGKRRRVDGQYGERHHGRGA